MLITNHNVMFIVYFFIILFVYEAEPIFLSNFDSKNNSLSYEHSHEAILLFFVFIFLLLDWNKVCSTIEQ